ncbi:hypothetical protein SDC9_180251 [bioreactor metagenome]|uniref:Uncharacterized protein n=1 Tax=bioreactor metagenome TaxID=1076179 RepID=A0A645H163_9ZZZZ
MHAIDEHAGVLSHLAQPAGDHGSAHAVAIKKHQPCTAHADELVACLHQLTTRCVLGARQAAGGEFLRCTHIA